MRITIKRKADFMISNWSGGSTTELFIFPDGSSYQSRDFEVRISSATVEEAVSVFTMLPSYRRLLMPINAPLKLDFEGQNKIAVEPFQAVEFEGAWKTTSYGVCTDIGIMFSDNWRGSLSVAKNGILKCASGFTGIYALSDNIKVIADSIEYNLTSGDYLFLEAETQTEIALILPDQNSAIITEVTRRIYGS